MHFSYYVFSDTWVFFKYGQMLFDVLPNAPLDFIRLALLPLPDVVPDRWAALADEIPFWNERSGYTMVRIQALLHLFSFGNYWVHVVCWAFLGLLGLMNLYQAFCRFGREISNRNTKHTKYILYLLVLIPSFLFWGSGVHKEGICFFSLGLILNHFVLLFEFPRRLLSYIWVILGLFLLFLVRPYTLGLLMPALFALTLCLLLNNRNKQADNRNQQQESPKSQKSIWQPLLIFGGVYALGIGLLAIIGQILPKYNVLNKIVKIREYFILYYNGNSDLEMTSIAPTWGSVLKNVPQAWINVFFRPTLWEGHNFLAVVASIETLLFYLFFLVSIALIIVKKIPVQTFLYFCVFFALSYTALIGLTVDNMGAIVRYRSVPYLFLVVGFLYNIQLLIKLREG